MNATAETKHGSDDISFGPLTTEAWRIYKANWKLLVACCLTIFGAWVILEILVSRGNGSGVSLNIILHLLFLLVTAGLQVGFLKIVLELHDGRRPEYGLIFRFLAAGPGFFLAQLILFFLVVVGLVFLLVPGLYFGSRYGLFGPLIADRGLGGLDSLSASARITSGRQVNLAVLGVFLAVLNFFGAAFLGIGLLLTLPLTYLIVASAYRRLSGTAGLSHSA